MTFRWSKARVYTAAGVAILVTLALLVPAICVYRPHLSKREWERYRLEQVEMLLHVINLDDGLSHAVQALLSQGHTANQAVAAVVKRGGVINLSPDHDWGGVPLLREDSEGDPMLVDMWGKPYRMAEVNGKLVLRGRD